MILVRVAAQAGLSDGRYTTCCGPQKYLCTSARTEKDLAAVLSSPEKHPCGRLSTQAGK